MKILTASVNPASSKADSYDSVGVALHWTIAALVACQFITAVLLPDIRVDTPLDTTINLHFNLGLAILVGMTVRLAHRWGNPVRVAPGDASAWERHVAAAIQRLFYAILLVGPFLGWAAASAHGVPVRLLGVMPLPELASRKAAWALRAGDIHAWMMWILLALVALHAAAALFHHFGRHADVRRRMWPWARVARPGARGDRP